MRYKSKIKNQVWFLSLFFCFFAISAIAKNQSGNGLPEPDGKVPRYDMVLVLEMPSGEKQGVLAERTVQVQLNGDLWQVNWLSVTKDTASETQYPTYEIKTKKGILEGPMVGKKTTYFHPLLWPEGYTILADAFPLWVDSGYLDLKRNQAEEFSLGLLKVKTPNSQGLDDQQYKEILYFRNLYDNHVAQKSAFLQTFDKTFFELRWIRDGKFSLKVNGVLQQLPVKILGNRYFEMTILDQYDNPLVLALDFYPERVPKTFLRSFSFLKKSFEFRVTQVQF